MLLPLLSRILFRCFSALSVSEIAGGAEVDRADPPTDAASTEVKPMLHSLATAAFRTSTIPAACNSRCVVVWTRCLGPEALNAASRGPWEGPVNGATRGVRPCCIMETGMGNY